MPENQIYEITPSSAVEYNRSSNNAQFMLSNGGTPENPEFLYPEELKEAVVIASAKDAKQKAIDKKVSEIMSNNDGLYRSIGGGKPEHPASRHGREYVQPLVDAAAGGIGGTLGATNPFITEVIIPNAWHVGKVMMNPAAAYTNIGAVLATGADAYGAVQSVQSLDNTVNRWINGNGSGNDIPSTILDMAGTIPAFNASNKAVDGSKNLYNTGRGSNNVIPEGSNKVKAGISNLIISNQLNRGMNPVSKFDKAVFQKRMDAANSDSFVREHLGFPRNIDESKIRIDPKYGIIEYSEPIFESPRTLIHWDGAATGNNSPSKVLTIGNPITDMKQVAHFENGKLVPANTGILVKNGPRFTSNNHPLMFADYMPGGETPMTGKNLEYLDSLGDKEMWKGRLSKYGAHEVATDYPHRIITIDSNTPGIKIQPGTHYGNRNSHEYYVGPIPMEKIKSAYEGDPTIKTGGSAKYVDQTHSSKGAYTLFERPSKLSGEEKLGLPKSVRNQPVKVRSPRSVQYDIVDGNMPTQEFLSDFSAFKQGLSGNGTSIDITDMFSSPGYKQRLLNQGLTNEQADQLIATLKARTNPENLVIVDNLNAVRDFSYVDNGIPMGITPERSVAHARHSTNVPGLPGKSLIQLTTKVDPMDAVLHEVGGHRSQPLVADFQHLYNGQKLTNMGVNETIRKGLNPNYYTSGDEVRARALTIAKQMSNAGGNPNSPGQVNVWLNKNIGTNYPSNSNQGALYYSRPEFVNAVTTAFKEGGKITS